MSEGINYEGVRVLAYTTNLPIDTTTLIVGIRIKPSEFPGNLQDGKWTEYLSCNGDICFFQDPDCKWLHIGKIMARYSVTKTSQLAYGFLEVEPNPDDYIFVNAFLSEIGINKKSVLIFCVVKSYWSSESSR